MLREMGLFPILNYYYEPFFMPAVLQKPLEQDRLLPGIDFNDAGQLKLLERCIYAQELVDLGWVSTFRDENTYYLNNKYFDQGDADFLYQFLRTIKPQRIIEIGSGHSTKVARLALDRNEAETGHRTLHTCIEPYEAKRLAGVRGIELIETCVEDCQLDWAVALGPGDFLFVDSSHMIRPQGDVLKEYLEILPQLASGVYVHIHDIFTPRDYLRSWLEDEVLFWNEQYLLEALLSDTNRYEVVAALNYLQHHHYVELSKLCPYLTADREPSSIYLRVR